MLSRVCLSELVAQWAHCPLGPEWWHNLILGYNHDCYAAEIK
jgi:hypothetical protein